MVLLLALTTLALPDGTYFRQERVEVDPIIPTQRAVLKFDGREQIMLVESELSGPEGTYGWVIPLPSKPSYVKAVNPVYIDGSFRQAKPYIRSDAELSIVWILLAIAFSAVALTSAWRHRNESKGRKLFMFCLEIALPIVLCAVFFPVFASAKDSAKKSAGDASSASVESLGDIGSYSVSVLSGESGAPILEWLSKKGLVVGKESLPVIEAYAKEGWCFLAAEIRKTESRSYPPHPLKAVFPTDKLIYPMRLTGLQDDPLRLELLVVSNRQAEIQGMEAWACDNTPISVFVDIRAELDREIYSDWKSGEFGMAKNGEVWTYLRGEFTPEQMTKDFEVTWKTPERFRAEVWDRLGARNHAIELATIWLVGASVILGLIVVFIPAPTWRGACVASTLALLISLSVASHWYVSVEKVDSKLQERRNYPY